MTEPYAKNVATSAAEAATIVPRAEFRVFGGSVIDTVHKRMWDAGATLQKARRMPAETYILSRNTSAANVKVRDGLLDIKLKISETSEGYEIFRPAGKFQFPVQQTDLDAILKNLKVDTAPGKVSCTFEAFLAMVQAHPDLVPVTVEKMRYGFTVDGVICEYAQVWFNGALLETACCESEHYPGIKKVIEILGISGMPNTSYVNAAKHITGLI